MGLAKMRQASEVSPEVVSWRSPQAPRSNRPRQTRRFRWWMPSLAAFALSAGFFVHVARSNTGASSFEVGTAGWWLLTGALHLPYLVILLFVIGGLTERVGYYTRGRPSEPPGRLPDRYPTVCVQLPMFNEDAVAQRVIEAACSLTWPADRLSVQVLDDSTDEHTKKLVEGVCARMRAIGVDCSVRHRVDRRGYKAGALEEGRRATNAEFLVIFDADFVPPQDYLLRTIPHFYRSDGQLDSGLALVQTQWGHLNYAESLLTQAQSLWVDDHHTLQMSWRSAKWRFVNFTGTAGVWRAAAIEAVGGWRAASLVEDCELSFRALFAGYRTKFVKEIVVPAELPATYPAYRVQQKRWTQGWVQLQRLHLGTLLFRFRSSWARRIHLVYHMCISWQWPSWALWISVLPFLIYTDLWFGSLGIAVGALVYLLPTSLFAIVAAVVASLETKYTYAEGITLRTFLKRIGRVVPYLAINAGMLPHQFSAFTEGLFGSLHSEFERTPKAASVTTISGGRRTPPEVAAGPGSLSANRPGDIKIHWPYAITESLYAVSQFAWAVLFTANGLVAAGVGAATLASCVLYVGFFRGGLLDKIRANFVKTPVGHARAGAHALPPSRKGRHRRAPARDRSNVT